MRPKLLIAVGTAAVLLSAPAFAHPRLLSATPVANTAVPPTDRIRLVFSERLIGPFSGADLSMAAKPGGKLMTRVPAKAAVQPDGHTLLLVTPARLSPGVYRLTYRVTSVDTHRVQGGYAFRVR